MLFFVGSGIFSAKQRLCALFFAIYKIYAGFALYFCSKNRIFPLYLLNILCYNNIC